MYIFYIYSHTYIYSITVTLVFLAVSLSNFCAACSHQTLWNPLAPRSPNPPTKNSGRTEFQTLEDSKRRARIERTFTRYWYKRNVHCFISFVFILIVYLFIFGNYYCFYGGIFCWGGMEIVTDKYSKHVFDSLSGGRGLRGGGEGGVTWSLGWYTCIRI